MTLDYANDLVLQFLADAREPHHANLIDLADLLDDEPTDVELVDALVEAFGMSSTEAVDRLARVDIAALREVVA